MKEGSLPQTVTSQPPTTPDKIDTLDMHPRPGHRYIHPAEDYICDLQMFNRRFILRASCLDLLGNWHDHLGHLNSHSSSAGG